MSALVFLNGNDIHFTWNPCSDDNNTPINLSGIDTGSAKLYLISALDKVLLSAATYQTAISNNAITFTIPGDKTSVGTFGLDFVYSKSSGTQWGRATLNRAFVITNDINLVTVPSGTASITSLAASIGDKGPMGLSAYELYVKNGGRLSEADWVAYIMKEPKPSYNIRLSRIKNTTASADSPVATVLSKNVYLRHDIFVTIEDGSNADITTMSDSDKYRFFYARRKKTNGGRQWCMPYFVPDNANISSGRRSLWWWAVTGRTSKWLNTTEAKLIGDGSSTGIEVYAQNTAATKAFFKSSRQKHLKIGCALFRKTTDTSGSYLGWERISNVAEATLRVHNIIENDTAKKIVRISV